MYGLTEAMSGAPRFAGTGAARPADGPLPQANATGLGYAAARPAVLHRGFSGRPSGHSRFVGGRWSRTLLWALPVAGALVGLAAGLGVDPSTEGGSDAYQAGYTEGAILRYCALGGFAGLLLAFLIRADSAWGRVGFGLGLAAILALGVVTAQEHTEEKGEGVAAGSGRAGSTAYRAPGSGFRAGYLSGCTKQVPREGVPPTKAREYCECIFDELSADRDEREFYLLVRRLERVKRSGGQNAPPGVVREYLACARRTGLA